MLAFRMQRPDEAIDPLQKAARRSDHPKIGTLLAAASAAASRDDEGRQLTTLKLSKLLEQFPAERDRQLATPIWK